MIQAAMILFCVFVTLMALVVAFNEVEDAAHRRKQRDGVRHYTPSCTPSRAPLMCAPAVPVAAAESPVYVPAAPPVQIMQVVKPKRKRKRKEKVIVHDSPLTVVEPDTAVTEKTFLDYLEL